MKLNILMFVIFTALSTSSFARSLSEIKSEILNLATSYRGQVDPDGSKQKAIEVLVDELLTQVPVLTMEEKAQNALGVWNQVWGPYAFDGSNQVPPGMDIDKIYQFISPEGFYYNFGEFKILGLRLKTFLRGKFSIEDDRINVVFTNQGLIREQDVDYAHIGDEIEADQVRVINFPRSLPPAGVKGALVEVYSDEEMRINYGVVGSDISKAVIFVMRRVN